MLTKLEFRPRLRRHCSQSCFPAARGKHVLWGERISKIDYCPNESQIEVTDKVLLSYSIAPLFLKLRDLTTNVCGKGVPNLIVLWLHLSALSGKVLSIVIRARLC